MRLSSYAVTAGLVLAAMAPAAHAAEISGAGATFPYPIYAKWADEYKKTTGLNLNYQSIGSGGGIKQIEAKTVTFGATDAPLKGSDLDKNGLVQFPMVMGGIVPVVNLDGIKPGETRDRRARRSLRDFHAGKVKTWDDAALQEAESRRQAARLRGHRGGAPFGRLGHDLQLHRLSRKGLARAWKSDDRHQHRGRMAGWHRRQGQ